MRNGSHAEHLITELNAAVEEGTHVSPAEVTLHIGTDHFEGSVFTRIRMLGD